MALANREVLLIDDDKDIRVLVRKILEGVGISVREARSVEEGLKMMQERVPHLILLDLGLGDSSGYTFLENRRNVPTFAKIPVLILSAASGREEIYKAISLGARDYISKPLKNALILQKVRKALAIDSGFMKVEFEPKSRPKVHVVLHGFIREIGDQGYVLEGPLKYMEGHDYKKGPNLSELQSDKNQTESAPAASDVIVRAPLLDEMGATKLVTRLVSKKTLPNVETTGRYFMEFSFAGITEEILDKVRRVRARWVR